MPSDLSSVAREAAERYVGVMDDPGELWVSGFTECASRIPNEDEIADRIAQFWADTDSPGDAARSVLSLIGEKISG